MRLISRAALVLAASLVAAPALSAQTSFSAAIGATVPMGDASDLYKMGYHATVGLGIKPPLAPVGVRVEGMFNSMDYKPVNGTGRVLAGIVNATLSGAGMPVPMGYLIGGLGLYNFSDNLAGSGSTTKFGFNVGAGLNIPLTGFGTFVEARLHYIATDNKATMLVPLSFGVKF